jgi:hypothetical protein
VTVASLADIGYTVNMAMADSFVPSGSSISLAVQASGRGASARLYASVDTTEVGGSAELPSATPSRLTEESHRRTLPQSSLSRIDRSVVDAVMTSGWHSRRQERDDNSSLASADSSNEASDAEFDCAWDSLSTSLQDWAAVA